MSSAPIPNHEQVSSTFCVQLDCQLDALATLEQWMEKVSADTHLSEEIRFKLDLLLEEAVTNVMQYGFTKTQEGSIGISLRCESQQVFLEIKDNGIPFNPLEDYATVLPNSVLDARMGGLGIHLIKNYAESIAYQREGNYNILSFQLSR